MFIQAHNICTWNIQTGSAPHETSCWRGTWGSFPRVQKPVRHSDHSLLSSAVVTNVGSYTGPRIYWYFMACIETKLAFTQSIKFIFVSWVLPCTSKGKVVPVHTMQAYGWVEVPLHSFLISAQDGVSAWLHARGSHSVGSWVRSSAGLGCEEEETFLRCSNVVTTYRPYRKLLFWFLLSFLYGWDSRN
jgi:hypothetical protein